MKVTGYMANNITIQLIQYSTTVIDIMVSKQSKIKPSVDKTKAAPNLFFIPEKTLVFFLPSSIKEE